MEDILNGKAASNPTLATTVALRRRILNHSAMYEVIQRAPMDSSRQGYGSEVLSVLRCSGWERGIVIGVVR